MANQVIPMFESGPPETGGCDICNDDVEDLYGCDNCDCEVCSDCGNSGESSAGDSFQCVDCY